MAQTEVTKIEKVKDDRGNDQTQITYKKKDQSGQIVDKTSKVWGEAEKEFTVPGIYTIKWSKSEKGYYFIESASLDLAAPKDSQPEAIQRQSNILKNMETAKSDSITAQVCVKASADIVSAFIGANPIKKIVNTELREGYVEGCTSQQAVDFFGVLMERAKRFAKDFETVKVDARAAQSDATEPGETVPF